ncbi:MarR family transcriptional regulator [uncultured Sneathiella sp.]|jgi:DNA-binding MarR family transcriptional regulator|uniref:MarR family winged helix-turn-helix transcriptional regulator n=1 Tax=uncultured Sneathiella sp. TaxID=879315 RepID=UPI002598B422|nr:MarR family transcriptional regulator [uncultured Sneathiella sp.]
MSLDEDDLCPEDHAHWLFSVMYLGYNSMLEVGDEHLKSIGLRRPHFRVLYVIQRKPGATVREVLAFLNITQQSISPIIKTLIADGFITQKEDLKDRRSRHLYLTRKGRAAWRGVIDTQRAYLKQAYQKVGFENAKGYAYTAYAMMNEKNQRQLEVVWKDRTFFLDDYER